MQENLNRTYPGLDELTTPNFNNDGRQVWAWDVGQLELEAVDEDLVHAHRRLGHDKEQDDGGGAMCGKVSGGRTMRLGMG